MFLPFSFFRCSAPPNFDLLTVHKKGKPELASYTNPNYFFECWAKEQQSSLQQRAKKKAGKICSFSSSSSSSSTYTPFWNLAYLSQADGEGPKIRKSPKSEA